MLKGYEDGGFRVKIVHWPKLWRVHAYKRNLADRAEDGKIAQGVGYIRYPYSTRSANGWNPFRGKQETPHKVSRWHKVNAMRRRRQGHDF